MVDRFLEKNAPSWFSTFSRLWTCKRGSENLHVFDAAFTHLLMYCVNGPIGSILSLVYIWCIYIIFGCFIFQNISCSFTIWNRFSISFLLNLSVYIPLRLLRIFNLFLYNFCTDSFLKPLLTAMLMMFYWFLILRLVTSS